MTGKDYINLMKTGHQVRIRYKKRNEDDYSPSGWWKEELWQYDELTDTFFLYYPVSSYDNEFYSVFSEKMTESFIDESLHDFNNGHGVEDIILESHNIDKKYVTLKEYVLSRIDKMDDIELKRLCLYL